MKPSIPKFLRRFNLVLWSAGFISALGVAVAAPHEDPLADACRRGDLSAVETLLKQNPPELRPSEGGKKRTALHFAVRGRASQKETRLAIVKLLLDRGADPNATSEEFETVLQTAVQSGWDEPLLDLLLARGAKIDFDGAPSGVSSHEGAPLHRAAARGDVRLVEYLLSRGADPNVLHHCKGETPLMVVFRPPVTPYGWKDFEDTRRRDDAVEIVKMLVGRGADLNRANKDGEVPLHYAAAAQHLACLRQMTSLGAIASVRANDGQTVLHYAAVNPLKGDQVTFRALIATSGMTANVVDKKGRTPLHLAVLFASDPAVQSLLLLGVDPDRRDQDGKRAVDLSVERLSSGTIIMLRRFTEPESKPEPPPIAPPIPAPASPPTILSRGEAVEFNA